MADADARVDGRKRGASPLPPPPAPPQPTLERTPSAAPEDDTEVARLRAVIGALAVVIAVHADTAAAQAHELVAQRAATHAAAVAHAAEASALRAALRAHAILSSVTSAASPLLFLAVLARLAENGYAREVVRCVNICRGARSNARLWARIVDLPHPAVVYRWRGSETRLLHWACEGDLARVRETLGRGADIAACDTNGRTALFWASMRGHLAVVRELLDHGADVSARNDAGLTPLMRACYCGHAATAAELLRVGADVNAVCNDGWSALMEAAIDGYVDVVRVLLAVPGVDVNLTNARGDTALSMARRTGCHAAVVALLEAAGAR